MAKENSEIIELHNKIKEINTDREQANRWYEIKREAK